MKHSPKLNLFKYSEALIITFIWLIIFISPIIIGNNNNDLSWDLVFITWIKLLPFLVLTIINHFILIPYLFFRKKIYYFASAIALLIIISLSLSYIQENVESQPRPPFEQDFMENDPHFEGHSQPSGERMGPAHEPQMQLRQLPPMQKPGELPPYIISVTIALLILGFDTGIRTIFKWTISEREREKLEKEKVKSELAFLRNQVSPHFFMNTLNNIHALIDIDTEEAKEAIIRLSKLMRHLLYDSSKETIKLEEEIGFIQSYVNLMKLRFTEKVKVTIAINTINPNVMIPPLLFTAFIENAFKYGVSYQQESFIDLALTTTEDQLIFVIKNSISAKSRIENKKTSTGIGLENTKKRLDIIYKGNYEMNIDERNNIFTVLLKLPL